MDQKAKRLYRIIREIRAGFHLLKEAGDILHKDRGITAAMRAVMEALADHGPQTVPDIAAQKRVSRQHIQVNVDALLAKDLVLTRANPTHKRSPLIDLSAKGRKTFSDMRIDEAALLDHLAQDLSGAGLDQAGKILANLNEALRQLDQSILAPSGDRKR